MSQTKWGNLALSLAVLTAVCVVAAAVSIVAADSEAMSSPASFTFSPTMGLMVKEAVAVTAEAEAFIVAGIIMVAIGAAMISTSHPRTSCCVSCMVLSIGLIAIYFTLPTASNLLR